MKALQSMRVHAGRALAFAAAGFAVLATASDADGQARSRITPYLEVQQVLAADLNEGDVLTYTSVGAGVSGHVETRRVQATISYNYQRRIAWEGGLADEDVHSGLAAVKVQVVPNLLTFDAGALATRSHADALNPIPNFQAIDDPRLVEVYSAYAGPTLSTKVGGLDVGASYRLGYVHIDDHGLAGAPRPAGQPRFDTYDHGLVHSAAASVGMSPGQLPFGWTVGAGWSREDSDLLDARNQGMFVRGDVVVPVGAHFAVTGGVGYEKLTASQQDFVRDAAGRPVLTPEGNLIADPSKPRLLAYDQSGLIWDVGVIWRPSRRTELQARVGRRYGDMTYTGSFSHQINENYSVSASVYDNVTSFGKLLIMDLNGLPVNFKTARKNNPFSGQFGGGTGGCVFGQDPGTGGCFDDALQAINSATFRNRGASIMFSGGRGPWGFGLGAGYTNRRYFAPVDGDLFSRRHLTDQSFSLQASVNRQLSRNSGIGVDAIAGSFKGGAAGAGSSLNTGISAGYTRTLINDRLSASLSGGVYHVNGGDYDNSVASVLFGLRYSF